MGLRYVLSQILQVKDMGLTEYVVTRWYRAPELLLENQVRYVYIYIYIYVNM